MEGINRLVDDYVGDKIPLCLEQIPETPAFVEIPMTDHIPAKSPEKLPALDGQPLLRIHNRAGISIDIFQDMPAEKLQSLVEALAYVQ